MSRRIAAGIWISAVVVRCFLAFGLHRCDYSRAEAQNIALSLAARGRFADAFGPGTGPTAHTAPVYPAINALLFLAAGDTLLADQLRVLFNIAVAGLVYALLPSMAVRLGLGLRAGLIAGIAGAVLPLQYWGELPGAFENTLAALLLLLFSYSMIPCLRGLAPVPNRQWLLGMLAGFTLLTSPALLFPIAALLYLTWRQETGSRRISVGRLALAAVLVLTPWSIRNLVQFHSFIFVRSNFGLELADSNNDEATADAEGNSATPYFQSHHPFASRAAAKLVRAEGEVVYSKRMMAEALRWIRTHPRRFFELSAERTGTFWFPKSRYALHRIALAVMTAIAFAGWALLWGRNRLAFLVLAVVPVCYSLTFVLVQGAIRFTFPIWWALLLSGSVVLAPPPAEKLVTCRHGSEPHRAGPR